MKKDAYYFSHDSNAKDDPKIMIMVEQLGLESYGIFWVLLETLREQADYKCPLILLRPLARRFATTFEKINAVVQNYDLFIIENEEFFYSESLMARMLVLNDKREKARNAINTRWNRQKALQENAQNDTEVIRPYNGSNTSKVNKSKVNKSNIKNNTKNILVDLKINLEFLPIVEKWFKYKSERKQTYTETGSKSFVKKLIKLSNNDINEAEEIIEQSMGNNWAGIFEVQSKIKSNRIKTNSYKSGKKYGQNKTKL